MGGSSLYQQVVVLTKKNLRLVAIRHVYSTWFRAFLLPVAFSFFLAFAKNLFIPPSKFGIGDARPVQSIQDVADKTIVFVDNNLGSAVTELIDRISRPVLEAGKATVQTVHTTDELFRLCRSNLAGQTDCYGAVVFNNFLEEENYWNYTIRADASLLRLAIRVDNDENAAQRVVMPLQLAVDNAINNSPVIPEELMFTSLSEEERQDRIRIRYMGALVDVLAVAFAIAMVGVGYHLTGLLASERESGLSQLITAMGGRQAARLLSHHIAFSLVYLPGWILISLAFGFAVFQKTNTGIVVVFHILSGLSWSSLSILGGSFFRKAQLSGITIVIASLLLAILAQVISTLSTAGTAILGILFTPMSYVYCMILMARWERENMGANLFKSAPTSPHSLPVIAFWGFLILQIILYPVLASFIENWLYGTDSPNRTLGTTNEENAVEILNFSRKYPPSRWGRNKDAVVAVENLSMNVRKGTIVSLLGANGSGKSTTNNAIAGLDLITSGEIRIAGHKTDLGVCPQNNVLWDDLTVIETLKLWMHLKTGHVDMVEVNDIIKRCDLVQKSSALSKTLSGGQKRKLQLAIMFVGGSKIGIVDEASSGLDPLSRRKLWDIILSERNKRTILLTTHYLEEADFLSDYIVILSKGQLKCAGSAAELKSRFGGGYRVHCFDENAPSAINGIPGRQLYDQTIYLAEDTKAAGTIIRSLRDMGLEDFHINGPTIEDVFLKVAEETAASQVSTAGLHEKQTGVNLDTGTRVGVLQQTWVMLRKRVVILRYMAFPILAAVLIPIITAAISLKFFSDFDIASCDPTASIRRFDNVNISSLDIDLHLVFGPSDSVPLTSFLKLQDVFGGFASPQGGSNEEAGFNISSLQDSVHTVDDYEEFKLYIRDKYKIVSPAGLWLSETKPTLAFKGNDGGLYNALLGLNILNNLLNNATIVTTYANFDISFAPGTGDSLQFITYFGLAMAVYPAFFALYPTLERLRNVRALHYSNGVRTGSLWAAYTIFDFLFVLIISTALTGIFIGNTSLWWYVGYIFVVLMLYGLAGVLFAYIVSLLAKSQLAAFAMVAGYQAVMLLLYMVGYMSVLTYSPIENQQRDILIVHFTMAIISPVPSFLRAMFASLNLFQINCRDDAFVSPGDIISYGGPITYLIVQIVLLLAVLVWWESGAYRLNTRKLFHATKDTEKDATETDPEIFEELRRVDSTTSDGLRVIHVSKSFGKVKAVQDVTFGVKPGEIFALLGPNGAGKSTTISMIRGVIRPDEGQIDVKGLDMHSKRKPDARAHLGVCPQFDACDQMTTRQHLALYAMIRGVKDVEHNVNVVLDAVGLAEFADRLAWKLSGGNRRKLSLAIALMGNPSVLLLDEPSSSMDSASQRLLWNILRSIAPGRSLLLTSHSMLEVDALANRAGIISGKMLAIGTTDFLREKHGNHYHIHLVLKTSPNTTSVEMKSVEDWIHTNFPSPEIQDKPFHGQIKFKVPVSSTLNTPKPDIEASGSGAVTRRGAGSIDSLFRLLEESKDVIGIDFYSISRTSMDEVFLNIVGKANVLEEGYALEELESRKRRFFSRRKNEL